MAADRNPKTLASAPAIPLSVLQTVEGSMVSFRQT